MIAAGSKKAHKLLAFVQIYFFAADRFKLRKARFYLGWFYLFYFYYVVVLSGIDSASSTTSSTGAAVSDSFSHGQNGNTANMAKADIE